MKHINKNKGLSREVFDNGNRPNTNHPTFLSKIIDREIGMATNQLDRLRKLHDQLEESMDKTESYLNTEIMQLEDRLPRYSPYKYPEREKFQTKLHSLEQERRRLKVERQREEHRLQWQLLALQNKQAQLNLHQNGELVKYRHS